MIINREPKLLNSYKINNRINLGIELLRMILCFWVILFHYAGNINKKKKILKTFYHVPTFMMISFYLTNKIFFTQNIIKIKQRLERLIIPFIIIPIIDLGINIGLSEPKKILQFKNIILILLLQYITGYKSYIILWFVLNLIIITIFYEKIFDFFQKKIIKILYLLIIISYWLQYSEINFYIFNKYKSCFNSLSYFIEMIPIASTGIILGYNELIKKLENYKINSLFLSYVIIFFTYNYNLFGEIKGYAYSGIKQNISSICLFVFFSLIPLKKINKTFFHIIRIIASYTGGIYYFQSIINNLLIKINYFKKQYILKCFYIYIIGYIICLFGNIIFKKNKLKYIFN